MALARATIRALAGTLSQQATTQTVCSDRSRGSHGCPELNPFDKKHPKEQFWNTVDQ